ncbi:tyrosine-type recombinase/integrase [Clostridium sporogenes]|uniref:tyrosine-type recombinase/integrase n=1 Tax=Clostridium sporogenes TaxID=1509 RepID=UPI0005EF23BA|nr:tyrosine-type recombinase/integrase [Clostridium sporogenes]
MKNNELQKDLTKIIVDDFGSKLTKPEFNQYVTKLRDYFIRYIIEEKKYTGKVLDLFKFDLGKTDIINSVIYYVVYNENVKSKSAIDDFLIALNMLFEEVINDKYFNQNLNNLQPFSKLSSEIAQKIEKDGIKDLTEKETFPAILDEEYKLIVEYLNNMVLKSLKAYEVKVIIKLLLLYGFSFDRIIKLKTKDYCSEKGTLSIMYGNSNRSNLILELPYELNKLMKSCLEVRNKKYPDVESLFVTTEGTTITHAFLSTTFKNIKKLYIPPKSNRYDNKNTFTTTGLAKYAVIQMILEGMNQSIILDLTGFKEDQFSYCQDYVNELKNLNRNRYVNHIIRGISTYDDI